MRGFLLGLLAIVLVWGIGLLVFVARLPTPGAGALAKADGVVVYTGVGGARVTTGMTLLQQGAGARLLISGVNPDTSRASLAELWPGEPDGFECCVDLGLEARSTIGNAREVGDWASRHGFKRLILVTSDYHMPRALLETRAQLPQAELIAWPVRSDYLTAAGRPATIEAWRLLAVEYMKYLAARARTLFAAL